MSSRAAIEQVETLAPGRGARLAALVARYPALPLVALIAVSAITRLATATRFDAPWIAPDEMIYGLSGRSFWATGHFTLFGSAAPFYGVYPALVGLPLHLLGPSGGVSAIQCAQAVVMSLAAAVVWAWARPVAGSPWALVAAALTLCMPALAYSGLLMSEAVFLPAGLLALWLTARALVEPTRQRQAWLLGALVLAVGARLQGLVLVPVLVTAALLSAWFARDVRVLRLLVPTWLGLVCAAALWTAAQMLVHGGTSNWLGAYGVAASSGYDPVEVARWVLRHAGDLFLLVLGIPLVATGLLAYEAARGRERDPRVRALAAISVSAALWLTVQVGWFASRYVGHLAERDLILAAPPLFTCLAVWLARGLPRPQPATSIVALMVAVPAILLPVRSVVVPEAVPDAFMTIPLARVMEASSGPFAETAWVLGAALLVLLAVLVPARTAPAIPVLVALALVISSVLASSEVARLTQDDRTRFFGEASRTWVDDATARPVTFLYSGSVYWNNLWATAFWNDRVRHVARLESTPLEGVAADAVRPGDDGSLRDASGRPLQSTTILASTSLTLVGHEIASIAQQRLDEAGLRLWRVAGVPRLATLTTGLLPNGDIVQPVHVIVYDCVGGRLELTLLGKQGAPVEISRNGRLVTRVTPAPGSVWQGSVAAPAHAGGTRICAFELRSSGLVGSTRIEFVRT